MRTRSKAILPQVCRGCRSLDELRQAPWLGHLQGLLTPQQQQAVAREAPERIEVPSGSRIKLDYEPGKPPVLAVRIQEIFGMLETPRIAGRRVPVLLHLLGPEPSPAASDRRPGQLLANDVSPGPQGSPPALSQARLAGGPVSSDGGEAAGTRAEIELADAEKQL